MARASSRGSRRARLAIVVAGVFSLLGGRSAHAAAPIVRHSELGLEYSLRVPDGPEKGRGGLLVLALHGVNESHGNFMRTMHSMEFLKGAVIAVPQAAANEARRWEESDLPKVDDLLRELQEEFGPLRTIVYGFSAGAYFTYSVALTYPKRVHAAIPHSGGLTLGIPEEPLAKKVAFYVIHGDQDTVVPTEQSRSAIKALEGAGVSPRFYEELKGVAHTLDHPATKRGFEWVEKQLGPLELADAVVNERLKAFEKAQKARDWDAAAAALDSLAAAPAKWAGKIGGLAKAHLAHAHDPLALAAIAAAGRLGEPGVGLLKAVPAAREPLCVAAAAALARTGSPAAAELLLGHLKGKSEAAAVAAAKALPRLGGEAAIAALVAGLQAAESSKTPDARREAIQKALERLTGQSLASAKEWKRWAEGQGKR